LVAVMLAIARVALRAAGTSPTVAYTFALGAIVLASRPGQRSLFIRQPSAVAVLGTCVALAYGRTRPALGGLGVALAALKPNFGVPLVVLMAVRRDTRSVLIGLMAAGLLTAGAAAVLAHSAGGPGAL